MKKKKIGLIERESVEGKESEQRKKQGKGIEKKIEKGKEKREGEGKRKGVYTKRRKKIGIGVEQEKGKGKRIYLKKGMIKTGVDQKKITRGDSAQKKGIGITGTDIVFKKLTVKEKVTGRKAKLKKEAGIIQKKETGIEKAKKEIIGIEANQKKIKVNRKRVEYKERKEENEKKLNEKEEERVIQKREVERIEEGKIEEEKKEQLKEDENDQLEGDKKRQLKGKGYELRVEQREKKEKGVLEQKEVKKGKEQKEKEKPIETEKVDKNLLKCKLINFCGTLELDGAFKYKGNGIEIKGDSLVIILSEYLNQDDNNIKIYTEKYEAKNFIQKMGKYKNNIDSLKFKKYNTIDIDDIKNNIGDSLKKLQEIADKEIICDKTIFIDKNDLILIENKREYPHHMPQEIRNFIEHSLFFISLYKNLKILEEKAKIHLLFVYDHSRNYNDEGEVVVELYKIVKENYEKMKLFPNKIKFYLVHSLPNLNLNYSIFNKLQTEINELKSELTNQKKKMDNLEKKIEEMESHNHEQNGNKKNQSSENKKYKKKKK